MISSEICQSTKQFSDMHIIKESFVFPNRECKYFGIEDTIPYFNIYKQVLT